MFITFEGIEGCGKTTQIRRLARRLEELSVPHVLTLEPGGTRVGGDIRRILLDSRNRDLSPLAELFLYEADRAQHLCEVILPALDRGRWVLCDRFFDATTVYQGHARGQDMALVRQMNREASRGLSPDITFLLDCPVAVGLERALRREAGNAGDGRTGQDRFERETTRFHETVRRGYLSLAEDHPERFRVMDATLAEDELASAIFEEIRPYLAGPAAD